MSISVPQCLNPPAPLATAWHGGGPPSLPLDLRVLVIDEADRLMDMGFEKTLTAILDNLPAERQTLLFSATQTKDLHGIGVENGSTTIWSGVSTLFIFACKVPSSYTRGKEPEEAIFFFSGASSYGVYLYDVHDVVWP